MADAAIRHPRGRDLFVPVLVLGILALAGAFGFLLFRAQQLPEGVVPVAWDRTACAHCRMHVGEPSFAAQAQLQDGQVLNFDDPGCLMQWLHKHPQALHAAYVHHHKKDLWLPLSQAGFVEVMPTPMGFGLGAVEAGTAGAITADAAQQRVNKDVGPGGAP